MGRPKKHQLKEVLNAIRGTGDWTEDGESFGNMSVIAKRLGVHRTTVEHYRDEWTTVKDEIYAGREKLKDAAENKIARKIIDGDTTMTIFYAKTQMRDRGYIERQEITGADGAPLIVVNWDNETNDQS